MRISLANSERSFSVEPSQPLLEAALHAGLNLNHSCNTGNCGLCRARLLEGRIRYPHGEPLGLSAVDAARGIVLLCQARAETDLRLEALTVTAADTAVIKRLPARIVEVRQLSHDVVGLYLRLPPAEAFVFAPGQYIDVMLADGRRRSFSIASPPHASRLLELHVRRVPGGELTERLFDPAARAELLSIEGPLGQFVYREPPAADVAAPLLLIGGGTGLAPLLCIIRHLVERGPWRETWLYWGVRTEADLYAHDVIDDLTRRTAGLHYQAVLSAAAENWPGRRGLVHEAVLRDVPNLAEHEVYASGPPAMIDAVRRDFVAHGVNPQRLYSDSFDYASDTLERQRSSAAVKS